MAERHPSMSSLAWFKKKEEEEEEEEEGARATPAQHPNKVKELLQADPDQDLPEEEDDWEHIRDFFLSRAQCLPSNTDASPEHRLKNNLLKLTGANLHDVVVTLLHCAPSCNRTSDKVLLELLHVLEDWPLHSTCTSDGDKTDIFPLAATRVLHKILQLPRCPPKLEMHFPHLFLALLFQISFSTKEIPEKVDAFWRECQQEGNSTNPSRFAVLTMKALLCHLGYEDVMFDIECKRGWETLLNVETHHYAVGLLAREMLSVSRGTCYYMASYVVKVLCKKKRKVEVPAMAFLVELLACPDMMGWDDHVLQLIPGYLCSESREMHRLVLRGLIVFCRTPLMAKRMQCLLQSLTGLLKDADVEMVRMALFVLNKVIQAMDSPIACPIALHLAERLLPLFDNDTDCVQILSIHLFREVMVFVEEDGEKPLKAHVRHSLLPLFFLLHDENQLVAEASWETLLRATDFLKKRKLMQLLEREEIWELVECLLVDYRSRAGEYLQQSMQYLQSPQESVQEAAIGFLGIAGWHLRDQQEKLQVIHEALQGMTNDTSLSISNMADETLTLLRDAEVAESSSSRLLVLQLVLGRLWRRLCCVWGRGCLCC